MSPTTAAGAAKGSGPATQEDIESGRAMLERYFAWAPTVDAFAPVRVEADFEAGVPDVRTPGSELVDAEDQHVRYHDRIHLLIVDSRDTYWVVEHRLASDGWADRDELLLAERPLSRQLGLGTLVPGHGVRRHGPQRAAARRRGGPRRR